MDHAMEVKQKLYVKVNNLKHILNSTEKVFYGGNNQFSYAACQWIEYKSKETGRHIHHALCGHGGERVIKDGLGKELFKVDGYEPISKTIYQYHGCKWHGCTCQPNRTNADKNKYTITLNHDKTCRDLGYNVVSIWECEKPPKRKTWFEKKFTPYPHYMVYDLEALLKNFK